MSALQALLTQLSTDAELKAQYQSDPETVMTAANLTEEEKTAMREGDEEKLIKTTGDNRVYGKHVAFPGDI